MRGAAASFPPFLSAGTAVLLCCCCALRSLHCSFPTAADAIDRQFAYAVMTACCPCQTHCPGPPGCSAHCKRKANACV